VKLYHLIGELDAILSIVKYRKSIKYYSEPKFTFESDEIKLEDVYHPLIDNPVSNTISIDHDIAITGSNMSGKSTFLRTIGINSVLSQSICTALAKTYESRLYRLITSISLKDALVDSKSYFFMEAEAIKRMIDVKDDDYPTIVLIDEIFKGTNPLERYAASMEILNTLGKGNTKTIVATHDLNILPELKGYEFYYFSENISSHAIEFNFKIHSGRTSTRNAIKILEYVKYPRELLGKINSRVAVMTDGSVEYNRIN
jgi:DNA mismatch repair ATPase MutS